MWDVVETYFRYVGLKEKRRPWDESLILAGGGVTNFKHSGVGMWRRGNRIQESMQKLPVEKT